MADAVPHSPPTDREAIRAELRRWWFIPDGVAVDWTEKLADALAAALAEAQDARRVGPLLSAVEYNELLRHDLWTEAEQDRLIRHMEAQDAVATTMNRENERLKGRVEELDGELRGLAQEVRKVLRLSRNHDAPRRYIALMGRGIKPYEVPLIAALLEPEE